MYPNLPETLASLLDRTSDEIEREHAEHAAVVVGTKTLELADGSGRWASLIEFIAQDGSEFTVRVAAPAPLGAPAWAQASYDDFRVERV